MSFPFSIIGIVIYAFYVVIVIAVVAFPLYEWILRNKSWKWRVIMPIALILISAPVAEELWIQYHFKTLCEDAGVHVKRQVVADGYYDTTGSGRGPINEGYITKKQAIEAYEASGFRFREYRIRYKLPGNKVSRVEKQKNGKWLLTIQDKPTSRYHLKNTYSHHVIGHRIKKSEWVVYDSKNNETISRDTRYSRYSNWIEGLWIRFIGSDQVRCSGIHPELLKPRKSLVDYTFEKL